MSNIKEIFDKNFLEYASYTIKDRAIPDLIDGLKPVQRRILHSLYEMDDGKYNKVANVVGNTMKYHPHGDASIYEALVNIANKEYFIDKQGNFGNILTGDEASAARYIECRLTSLAKEVLYNPDITEYTESYDGRNKEPVVLPAKVPVILMLGTEGIAVGMSTKILPHNFIEIMKAEIDCLEGKPFELYPDFQQGGLIDVSEYKKGNGKIRVRAKIEIVNDKTLVIREIPFGTTTESLIKSIENAVKENKIRISSITDFTTEKVEIEIKTARGENSEDLLDSLYAFTDCENTINVNMLVIINNKPKVVDTEEVIKFHSNHLKNLLERELKIEEKKLNDRLHYLTLEQIFIENRIYKKIEELEDYNLIITTIKNELYKYKELFIRALTDEDIEKLLELKIKRISRYDINKNRKEIDDIVRALEKVRENLSNIKKYTINYLKDLIKKYENQYPRRTKIEKFKNITIKEVKAIEEKFYINRETGFAGFDVKSDNFINLTRKDKIIVFYNNGKFKILPVDSKIFIDLNTIYINKYEEEKEYTVIYTDKEKASCYIKKFYIKQFIQNKLYNFIVQSNNFEINYFSDKNPKKLKIVYKPKPKQKVNEEELDLTKYLIKNYDTLGNKIADKEIEKILEK